MQMAVRLEPSRAGMDSDDEQSASYGRDRSLITEELSSTLTDDGDGADDLPPAARNRFASPNGLATRMQVLIKAAGGMAAIARRCGFSQGAVRSWRDGHSDMSRERCVVLARTFGISLVWLMTGEGPMREQPEQLQHPAHNAATFIGDGQPAPARLLNPRVLAAALRLLQSYIGLLGGSLDPDARAHALVELYQILDTPDAPGHTSRLIAFHAALNSQLRGTRP